MKLHGLQTHDPSLALLESASAVDSKVNITEHADVASLADLYIERASLIHDPSQNFRPSVRLDGEIRRIIPASAETDLGYGISDIVYDQGYGIRMSGFYEFTDDQLQVMVSKGYFTDAFTEPEVMMNNTYVEMPMVSTINIIHPDTADQMPVAVVQVKDVDNLSFTFSSCGYDLAENFPDVSSTVRSPEVAGLAQSHERQVGESNLSHDVLAGLTYSKQDRSSHLDLSGETEQSQHSEQDEKNPFDEIVEMLDVREMLAETVDDAALDELREIYEQRIQGAQSRRREQLAQQEAVRQQREQEQSALSQAQTPESEGAQSEGEQAPEQQSEQAPKPQPETVSEQQSDQQDELTDNASMAQLVDIFAENPIFRQEEEAPVDLLSAQDEDEPTVRRSPLQMDTGRDSLRRAHAEAARRSRERRAERETEADRASEPEL